MSRDSSLQMHYLTKTFTSFRNDSKNRNDFSKPFSVKDAFGPLEVRTDLDLEVCDLTCASLQWGWCALESSKGRFGHGTVSFLGVPSNSVPFRTTRSFERFILEQDRYVLTGEGARTGKNDNLTPLSTTNCTVTIYRRQ
jgi:hypothetical protein